MSTFDWQVASIFVSSLSFLIVLGIAVTLALVVGVGLLGLEVVRHHSLKRDSLVRIGRQTFNLGILALIGCLAGQLCGMSRQGVVGDVVPALLGAFGAFMAYYFGEKQDASGRVALHTAVFLIGFFFVYSVASTWRQDTEAWIFCRDLFASTEIKDDSQRLDRAQHWGNYCQPVFDRRTGPGAMP